MTETKKSATVAASESAPKRRRLNAQDVEDHTVSELAKALGGKLQLGGRDLPTAIIRHKILDLLTIKERSDVFQRGFMYLPPPHDQDAKLTVPEGAKEFVIPEIFGSTWFADPESAQTLIEFWKRSGFGEHVTRLVYLPIELLSNDTVTKLLKCFPKATDVELRPDGSANVLLGELRARAMIALRLPHVGLLPVLNGISSVVHDWRASLRVLHLGKVMFYGGTIAEDKLLFSALGPELRSLSLHHAFMPSPSNLKLLWTNCTKLVDWTCAARVGKESYSGRLAKSLEGDTRAWEKVELWFGEGDTGLSTEDLLAFAGPELKTLVIRDVLPDVELDMDKVLSKCVALEHLDIGFDSDRDDDIAAAEQNLRVRTALFKSLSAKTATTFHHPNDADDWDEKSLCELYERLPRLAALHTKDVVAPPRLLDLLAHADRRERLTTMNIAARDAKAVSAVLLNSTRWRTVKALVYDGAISEAALRHLGDRCQELHLVKLNSAIEGMSAPTTRSLFRRLRGESLVLGKLSGFSGVMEIKDVTLADLLTKSTRPRSFELHSIALVGISGSDLMRLQEQLTGTRGTVTFLVLRAAAVELAKSQTADHPRVASFFPGQGGWNHRDGKYDVTKDTTSKFVDVSFF